MTSALVRTILGDDPHTLEDDTLAEIRDDVTSAYCVEVPGFGQVLYSSVSNLAILTQGPGTERYIPVVNTDRTVELTIIKNSRGQRRLIVVLEGCCEEHFPSLAMTREEKAEHLCPACSEAVRG